MVMIKSKLLDGIYERLDEESKRIEEERKNRKPIVNAYVEHWNNHIACSECSTINKKENNYCVDCGHKLRKINDKNIDKKYCTICGEKVDLDMDYCSKYGHKIELKNKIRKCGVCGEWIDEERYCMNCGHDTIKRNPLYDLLGNEPHDLKNIMKCPNCGRKYQRYFHYCHLCGEKLVQFKK